MLFCFTIAICLIFNLILLIIYIEKRNLLNKSYSQIISCNSKYDLLLNSETQNLVLRYTIEGSVFEDYEGLSSKFKLFYKFNNRSCSACIENVSNLLKSNYQYYADNNTIVIGNFINYKEKQFYEKEYFPVIIDLHNKGKENNLDKACISYFFTLDSEKRIRNVFIPDKNFPILTDIYLKNIFKCQY